MAPRPRADRTARRAELASAAAAVFAKRGVANTAVSDIVREAGVAQGTLYLYFDSKDDVVLAVVEQVAERMLGAMNASVEAAGSSAVEKLLGLRDVLVTYDIDPAVAPLAEFLHRPENSPIHDRLAENLIPGILPVIEAIIAQGVAEGVFDVADTRAAAWFVLGGLRGAEFSGVPAESMPAAIRASTDLALRALGYREASA